MLFSEFIFTKIRFTAIILQNFCYPNKNIFFVWIIFGKILVGSFVESCLQSAPSAESTRE